MMKDILGDLRHWTQEGASVVIARVVTAQGSVPRGIGAAMAVSGDGRVAGSVSGGCVEDGVIDEAFALFRHGAARVIAFGACNGDEHSSGPTCGGRLRVLLTTGDELLLPRLLTLTDAQEPFALATVVSVLAGSPSRPEGAEADALRVGRSLLIQTAGTSDRGASGSLGADGLDAAVEVGARARLQRGAGTESVVEVGYYGRNGEEGRDVEVLLEVFAARPRMVICGAADYAAALCAVARLLGYRVTVCDPRPHLATAARFPQADELVVSQPDGYLATMVGTLTCRDAVCLLTHDPKIDVPTLQAALASDAGYIGAMGSRASSARRRAGLLAAGVGHEQLARVRGPVGLDVGAQSAEETAVSIGAEIVALRAGRSGRPLRDGVGPIHPDAAAAAQLERTDGRAQERA